MVDPRVSQLDAGAFAHVPGAQAQGYVGARLGQFERTQDAVMNANAAGGGRLALKNAQIEGDRGVDLGP